MVNVDSDGPIFRAFLEQSRPRSEGPVVGFEGNYVQKWAFLGIFESLECALQGTVLGVNHELNGRIKNAGNRGCWMMAGN